MNRKQEPTAVHLAYEWVRAGLPFPGEDTSDYDDEDVERHQVLLEALEAQMPRWAVYDDPLPYLKEQLAIQSKKWEELPSEDAEDRLLYFLGFAHGLVQATPLRALTAAEETLLSVFLWDLLGLGEE